MRLRKNSGKIFWGLFFILAAVYVVVSKLWIVPEIGVFSILMTVFFIWLFITGIRNVNFWEILFSIAFLCIIYDEPLHIEMLTPWTVLGAALLGSIGLSMMFKKKSRTEFTVSYEGKSGKQGEQCSGEEIYMENSFGSVIKYINSDNFCRAKADNSFGSLTVYFDNAVIQSQEAKVHIDNSFGETNLYIPKEWKTDNEISQSFGNVNTYGKMEGTSCSVLRLYGETSFGTINIYYI